MAQPGDYLGYLDNTHDAHLEHFKELLRIPSISTSPENKADVAQAADWVANYMREAGIPEVEVIETTGHPVVLGHWHATPGAPTVLFYGHYDVQPVDPLNLWHSDPFEPTLRDDRIYARGAADMKANLVTLVNAVEAVGRAYGNPPINMTFLFEGEEEIGSPSLPSFLIQHKDKLKSDVALSVDGGMGGPDLPTLGTHLKGLAGCQVDLRTGRTDLHSGMYGATVPNAVREIVALAATFHNPDGTVAIEGFYDDVKPMTQQDRDDMNAFPYSDAAFLEETGVKVLKGDPGYTPEERMGGRPTVDFNGIWGGFQGVGTKTVTPAEAHLKITCRLVHNQDPAKIIELIRAHVAKHTPDGIEATVVAGRSQAKPFAMERDASAMKIAALVLRGSYDKDPYYVRSGGTVPVTEMFQSSLGIGTVTLGWGLPGSNIHAPNEWFRVADFAIARRTLAEYIVALAGLER